MMTHLSYFLKHQHKLHVHSFVNTLGKCYLFVWYIFGRIKLFFSQFNKDSVRTKDMEEKAQKGVKGLGKGLSAAENAAGVVEGVAQLSGAEDVADVAGQLGDGADIGVDAADIGSGCCMLIINCIFLFEYFKK